VVPATPDYRGQRWPDSDLAPESSEPANEADVMVARRYDVPIHAQTAKEVSALGYPVTFPTILVPSRSMVPLLDTSMRMVPFASDEAAKDPRIEDVVVTMLEVDSIGARALLDRNLSRIEGRYLFRRILEEHSERRATLVRFSDVLPGLPRVGESLPANRLLLKLRKNAAGTGVR
jgi:hypothetical protein